MRKLEMFAPKRMIVRDDENDPGMERICLGRDPDGTCTVVQEQYEDSYMNGKCFRVYSYRYSEDIPRKTPMTKNEEKCKAIGYDYAESDFGSVVITDKEKGEVYTFYAYEMKELDEFIDYEYNLFMEGVLSNVATRI